jgi:hypothetical protein
LVLALRHAFSFFSPILLLPGNVVVCFLNPFIATLDESRKVLEARQVVRDFLTFTEQVMQSLKLGLWLVL